MILAMVFAAIVALAILGYFVRPSRNIWVKDN